MPHTLILGYGNTLRGDDGAGYIAAERLQAAIADPEIEVQALHQLTPELALNLSQAAHAIFIDASAAGRPGRYMRVPLHAAPACAQFTHHATPEALLSTARALYGQCAQATLYLIPGQDFETPDRLSRPVQLAVDQLVSHLTESLRTAVRQG
ncbi:MAG TPA: hydrogenase maturation protease [Candidatus Acidoferrales bacterium]|nr:hydrogenase maturation protease [Candidatus Acidoferrales bacterium]